jgi:hypothetical protein
LNRRKFFCDKDLPQRRGIARCGQYYSAALFEFAPVEGRAVFAGFDGGAIT